MPPSLMIRQGKSRVICTPNAMSNCHKTEGLDVNHQGSTLVDFSFVYLEDGALALLGRGREDKHRSLSLAFLCLGLLASILEDSRKATSNR